MVLGNHGRTFTQIIFGPLARFLVRKNVSPNVVTIIGGALVCVAALTLIPQGWLLVASLTILVLALVDSLDGIMAREAGTTSQFGAFLDSVVDRFSDGAIFAGLLLYFYFHGEGIWQNLGIFGALGCLIFGGIVPYARAKAESLRIDGNVGLAERADRLLIAFGATFLVGFGLSQGILAITLIFVSVLSFITVIQRGLKVQEALSQS